MSKERDHPLIRTGQLPDWLQHVPIDPNKPIVIPIGGEKVVSL